MGVGVVGTGDESQPGSSRTLNRSPSEDDKFWVPHNLKRQASVCHSENADTSGGKFLFVTVQCTIYTELFLPNSASKNESMISHIISIAVVPHGDHYCN